MWFNYVIVKISKKSRQKFKSSCPQVFCKKGVHRKLLCWSLFTNKTCNFKKKETLKFRCFPENLAKFLKWHFLRNISEVSVHLNFDKIQKQPRRCSVREGVFRTFSKFTRKHLHQSLFVKKLQACNFIKKKTLAQMFSCEFCEISKNNIFTEHLWATASENYW